MKKIIVIATLAMSLVAFAVPALAVTCPTTYKPCATVSCTPYTGTSLAQIISQCNPCQGTVSAQAIKDCLTKLQSYIPCIPTTCSR